jgi:hypothetical protein
MSIKSISEVLEEGIKAGFMEYREKGMAEQILKKYDNADVLVNALWRFAEKNSLKGFIKIWNQYKAAEEASGQVEQMSKTPVTNSVSPQIGINSGGINSEEPIVQKVNTLPDAMSEDFIENKIPEMGGDRSSTEEFSEEMIILDNKKISNQINANITYTLPHKEGESLLERAVRILEKAEESAVEGCINLFLAWEGEREEDADLYEFLEEVEVLMPQMSRGWIQRQFHAGETIVQVGRRLGQKEDWIIGNRRLQSIEKWSAIFGRFPKRSIRRADQGRGRPLELLEEIPENLMTYIEEGLASEELQNFPLPEGRNEFSNKKEIGQEIKLSPRVVKLLKSSEIRDLSRNCLQT